MKIRQAERITGYEIWPDENQPKYTFVACDGTVEVARASGKTEKDALRALVEEVYRIHSETAMKRAGYRCERCGSRVPLQCHHVVFRSHGRVDSPGNLKVLCLRCHEKEHGLRA